MSTLSIPVLRLPHSAGLPLPAYRSEGAAGMDLSAAIPVETPVEIPPGGRVAVPTGIALAIPAGHEGQVRPRSGLARDHGVTVVNAPGTIDADYRGEIVVLLINLGKETFTVSRGMRIAQLVIVPVTLAELEPVDRLEESARGAGGFGSTGLAP